MDGTILARFVGGTLHNQILLVRALNQIAIPIYPAIPVSLYDLDFMDVACDVSYRIEYYRLTKMGVRKTMFWEYHCEDMPQKEAVQSGGNGRMDEIVMIPRMPPYCVATAILARSKQKFLVRRKRASEP